MLLLVSIILVLVGVVTLIIGIFSDTLAWVFVSIGSTLAAGVVLYVLNRLGRRTAVSTPARATSVSDEALASATAPHRSSDVVVSPPPAVPAPVAVETEEFAPVGGTVEVDLFPIDEYDELRVSEILPLLPQLDPDELEVVRDREVAGKARDSILVRIDELLSGEGGGQPGSDAFDVDFPIADYDELRVAEIVPLLSELDADELEVVADHEERGANRATILTRIEARLSSLDGGRALATPAPAARKATAAPAKRAPSKAPVKKAAAPAKAPAPAPAPAKRAASAAVKKAAPAKAPAPAASAVKKAAPAPKAAVKRAAPAPVKTAAKKAAAAPVKKATPATKAAPAPATKAAPAPVKKAAKAPAKRR